MSSAKDVGHVERVNVYIGGFSAVLVKQLENEDAGEFCVKFRTLSAWMTQS